MPFYIAGRLLSINSNAQLLPPSPQVSDVSHNHQQNSYNTTSAPATPKRNGHETKHPNSACHTPSNPPCPARYCLASLPHPSFPGHNNAAVTLDHTQTPSKHNPKAKPLPVDPRDKCATYYIHVP